MGSHFTLHIALFDSSNRTAHGINFLDVFISFFFKFVSECFNIIGTGHGVDSVGNTAFVSDELLGTQCKSCTFFRREGNGFVIRAAGHRLNACKYSRHSLPGNAGNVVQRLLCC